MPNVIRNPSATGAMHDVEIRDDLLGSVILRYAVVRCDCPSCLQTREEASRIERQQATLRTLGPEWVASPMYADLELEPELESNMCSFCNQAEDDCMCWNCDRCGDRYRSGRGDYCGECERCGACCECSLSRSSARVFDYSEKAEERFGFFPDRDTLPDRGRKFLYLGIELECERKTNCDNNLEDTVEVLNGCQQYQNWALCKHDGSLDCGFEVVSAPSELSEHKKRWPNILKIVRKDMSAWRRPSTGLHVHLSRSWFSSLDLAKFVYFINAEENRHYIIALAGRTSPDYGRLQKKKLGRKIVFSEGRYEAVNLSNSRTIEVRMFKGTLNTQHVLANLEFCHALANYVKEASIQECNWSSFWSYVLKHEKTYKHLVDYIRVAEPKLKKWIVEAQLESFFEYTETQSRGTQFRELDTERELSQIVEPVHTPKPLFEKVRA